MAITPSIYLEDLSDAQCAFVKQQNEQFRRPWRDTTDDPTWHDYITPGAERYTGETIKRWLAGERIEIGEEDSPRDQSPADILLAHLSNLDNCASLGQQLALALVLPSMIEGNLAFAAERSDGQEIPVKVATFDNCRENGLVYSVMGPDDALRSFSVYEHRNTDSIIINGCTDWDGEGLPYAADSKHGFFAEFACHSYQQAADALSFYIVEAARGELANDQVLVATAEHRDWLAILSERIHGFADWANERGARPADRMHGLSVTEPSATE